jgi:hypothetical protein
MADEPIILKVGKRTVSPTTDSTGSFTVEYQPTLEPIISTEIDVRYMPETRYPSPTETLFLVTPEVDIRVRLALEEQAIAAVDEFILVKVIETPGRSTWLLNIVLTRSTFRNHSRAKMVYPLVNSLSSSTLTIIRSQRLKLLKMVATKHSSRCPLTRV